MKIETITEPAEFATIAECSRRLGSCEKTLRAAIAKAGLIPDGMLTRGTRCPESPLFRVSRLGELNRLIEL